jgi:4-hydroxyphenylacetate 3-monooxygenase
MAALSGSEFLERRSAARVHVEIQGQTLTGGVADHPAFRNVVRSYAELYDMQHDPAYRDILTYPSPTSGEPVATSFLVPQSPADLVKRRQAFKLWADRSFGMLGRTGDYLNSALMALASAQDWFAQADPNFGENIRRFYEKVREEDLLCTHTLIPPQANRAVSGSQQAGGSLMAHIVREDDNGIVLRGARIKLFRLVWDTCISAFSGRQALYEYYFFGDPVRMAGAYVAGYDREPYQAAVRAFLDRG